MRPFPVNRPGSALIALSLLFCTGAIRIAVASDYEFARQALENCRERNGPQVEDLIERLATRLLNAPTEPARWEGRLIQALVLRHRATTSSPEKKVELLGQAEATYSEFLQKAIRHPLIQTGPQELASVRIDFIRALLAGEDDGSPTRAEARRRAVAMVEGMLPERKAASETAWTELEAIRLPDNPDANIPPALLRRLGLAIEKTVMADQAYLNAWLLLIEACVPGDRRNKDVQELAEFCQKRVDHERLVECELAGALYLHLKGRAFAFRPDEIQATEAWSAALGLLPENVMEEEVARTVFPLQASILFDYVKMKMKGSEQEPSRCEDVVRVVRGMLRAARWAEIAKLPAGKLVLIDYSIALVRQPESSAQEVTEAFRHLREVSAGGLPWSNNAALAMVQVLKEAGPRKQPKLGAQEWYETARGSMMQAQRALRTSQEKTEDGLTEQADVEKREAFQHFEQAVQFYRRAIAVARNPEMCDPLTRLKVEPNAWFETGICYQKMACPLEACAAYQALSNTFGKNGRDGWLPRPPDQKARKQIEALEAELDKAEEGLLQRAMNNRKIATRGLSPRDRDRIGAGDLVTAYERGRMLVEEARRLEEQAAEQQRNGHREEALKTWKLACEGYLKAAGEFTKEDPASAVRDLALYHAGYSNLLAQTVLVDRLARSDAASAERMKTQAADLAKAGLQAFGDFETHASMARNPAPETIERQEKLRGTIRQARVHLLYNAERLEECIAAGDECLKAERIGSADAPRDANIAAVLFARYRAFSRLAAKSPVPACDAFLDPARTTAEQLKAHDGYFRYALADLAARYFQAAQEAERMTAARAAETGTLVQVANPADGHLVPDIRKYERWMAEYTWRALKAQPEEKRGLEDYSRLLSVLARVKDWIRTCEAAREVLTRFDPEKKNARMADTEWPVVLGRIHQLIRYPDLQRMEACRKDHTVLIDYLYEDPRNEGLDTSKRPEEDRYPVDLAKAALQAGTIRRNYPDCATLNPQQGLNGRSWLSIVEEEVDYRRRMLATRDLLAEAAIEAANQVAGTKPEEAVRYRDTAREQLEILLEFWGNVPSVKIKIADLKIANQDFDGALTTLWEVKSGEKDPSSELYIRTSVQISRVYRMKGDAIEARRYPEFLIVGGPWQKYFPDIHEFLEWCYRNGAPRPKEVAPVEKTNLDYSIRTPDEKKLIEELEPAYRKGRREDLPPSVVWRYEFMKKKVEQAKELAELDRSIQQPAPGTDEAVLARAKARYAALEKIGAAKTRLWKLLEQIDETIVDLKSLDRARKEKAALFEERDRLAREIGELEAQL